MSRVLVGCERSGIVSAAFRKRGFVAHSADLARAEADADPKWHLQEDVFAAIAGLKPDLLIAHPPCTYLCSSGLHWNRRLVGIASGRPAKTEAALVFVQRLMGADVERICIENPRGCIGTRLQVAIELFGFKRQSIQPYEFGHDASKETVLWTKNLPPLVGTKDVAPRIVDGKRRWANQTDSGQNKLGPSPTRWMERSRTYQGIADAMADQWRNL